MDGPGTEIEAIRQTMRSDRASYNADAGMQNRLIQLYQADERGVTPPPKRSGGELERIQQFMKTDLHRYWRDKDMQARYLQLLERKVEQSRAEPKAPDAGALVAVPSPSQWRANGNDPAAYEQHTLLVREVNDILGGVEDDDRVAVGDSFASLPSRVHRAALAELTNWKAVPVTPFSPEVVQTLARLPSYGALVKE